MLYVCIICPDNRLNGQLVSPVSRAKLGLSCEKHGLSINPTAPYLASDPPAIPHSLPHVSLTSCLPSFTSSSKDCLGWTNQSSPCIGRWHAPAQIWDNPWSKQQLVPLPLISTNQLAVPLPQEPDICHLTDAQDGGGQVWLHPRHRHMCGHFPGPVGAGCQGGRTR